MCWNITKGQGRVAVSNFGTLNAYKNGPIRFMNDLLPERFNKDYPLVRFAVKPTPFYTSFFLLKGNTLLKILGPSWIHLTENMWCCRVVDFMLGTFGDILRDFGTLWCNHECPV